jgi:tRNA (guanine37-N1)-methyltransferase
MKIKILTLFPELFNDFISTSIIKRLVKEKKVKFEIINFREYSKQKNKQVDDYVYGGGGMLLMLQPLVDAIKTNKTKNSKVILLSPHGKTYTQAKAKSLSKCKEIILICGRYEGFDERIMNYVDEVISIGDYVLMGGEIPAMVVSESIVRLLDEGINALSLETESFNDNLLDYASYTKPVDFEGHKVPSVFLSGNHKKIKEFRKQNQIERTKKYRSDLLKK